ncbi:hypothetical protein [Legionella sp. km772]|uniref:hypothetical protein n=1 Tax=Legionella sp. km772 TaxID=2498111 RepID=UPI000F8D311B|nr:hypothetical protein [Legionella sp. km772]RUR12280.1 hypothetical protein ELY15_05640 [Legionella sp. km772]
MRQEKHPNLSMEVFLLLVQGSLRSIPFNAVLALLLGVDFIYNRVPSRLVTLWLIFFSTLILIRWLVCSFLINSCYARSILSCHIFKLLPSNLVRSKNQFVLNSKVI